MATTIKATRQVVEDYQRLFVNRRAYTMQSMRPHPETGRHYYFRPSKKGTDIPLMLTDETIRQHLEGKITVGLYAINPSTQRCKWVAIDADYKNCHGGPAEAAVPPDTRQGGAGAGNEQARRASLDLPGNAAAGPGVPNLYP